MTLSQFTEQVAAEFDRVSKFESHFGERASHINEAAYEIARVNVIFKTQGKSPLC